MPFKQLFPKHGIAPQTVLHLGANEGQEAESYQALGVKTCIWVEALPEVFTKLQKNVKGLPGHRCFCSCVSDVNGAEVEFNIASNEAQSSSFLQFGTHSKEHPTVKFIGSVPMKTTRVDTLLDRAGITIPRGSFLNIDLQGAELLALKGMGTLLGLFDWAYIEVNRKELYKGCPMVGDIDNYLKIFNLFGVEEKWTGNGWGDKLYKRGS